MSIKTKLVKFARAIFPKSLLRTIESAYRIFRVGIVSAMYGFPARSLRVIAVTGTNGKTTTANFLNEILKQAGYTTALFSTATIEVNGKQRRNDMNVTVATTVQMQRFFKEAKRAQADFVVLEITSHALDQYKLALVPIDTAIMTNLTQDHLDYHKTMKAYASAKARLFKRRPRHIILNSDDAWFDYFNQFSAKGSKVTYGESPDANIQLQHIKETAKSTSATALIDNDKTINLRINIPGKVNIYNAAAAAAAAHLIGVEPATISKGVANLKGVPGRFEYVIHKPYNVVVDYAHTPDAIEKLLISAKAMTKGKVTIVFGSCGDRDKGKRPIMGELAAKLADTIVLTDEENYTENADVIRRMIYEGIKKAKGQKKTTEIADRREAIAFALNNAKKDDMILITGLGHEVYRVIDGVRIPWNDADVVREILAQEN
ncbi:MAG TPA: UDP-N-acetylmuramoyl-L-alanyl-D-glutamate--2,6-diaminopimelate ligase [Candidatus Saccharibacteria bacterium]|nr:UDP-N-acetylmuramoyl-L-alanyl-D-glutamate--2,6-diaminopimelate ligase [Candidatus Saccharibacteria bacterium]